MRILQVNTSDNMGGAEAIARQLFQAYHRLGHPSWLAVGQRQSKDPNVLTISNNIYRSWWARTWIAAGNLLTPLGGKVRGMGRLRNLLQVHIGQPGRLLNCWSGKEDFDFPGTRKLLNLPPERPDIVNCHNLHGSWPDGVFFDLRYLARLSRQVPVVLTLHDEWLLSGHCAHTFDCNRWKTGCGHCPDLTIHPAVLRDRTAYNWQQKQKIFSGCRLYVTTPSQWLMQEVEQSILASAISRSQVIPNGVDLSIFHSADKLAIRAALGIHHDSKVLLFTANGIRRNVFKDYRTLRSAVARVAGRLPGQSILFVALGEGAPRERIGAAEVRFVPYQKDPLAVACYYQAADVYIHAARADTFPTTVLEALACGTPVVATAVGGIPEQVMGLRMMNSGMNSYAAVEATGVLVPMGDASAMAEAIVALLTDDKLRLRLGQNAAIDARRRFALERQVDAYLKFYEHAIEDWRGLKAHCS
jgi:glycosyltransferase involved in cell wall biosynthesis